MVWRHDVKLYATLVEYNMPECSHCDHLYRVSNLKYGSVRIDFKTVVFIRANQGKKETTDGLGLHVIFFQDWCTFPKVIP